MSELPQGWEYSTLQELGLPKTTNVDPKAFPDETFELYSVPSYSSGTPETVKGAEIGSTKQLVHPGDVLLCKIVPHLVRVWVVPERKDYRQIASGEWILVRPTLCNPTYIRRLLMEPSFRAKFMETVSGVGGSLLRARPKAVSQISIPVAPENEQRRVVAKLDSLFDRTRRAREELPHIPRLIENYKKAILEAAFRGDLTREWRNREGIKTPWQIETVRAAISDIRYGTSKKCTPEPHGTPVLRIPNVTSSGIDLNDLKFTDLTEKELEKLSLNVGDVLVVRSNGSVDLVGRSVVVEEQAVGYAYAGYLIRLRPRVGDVDPAFLSWMLSSPQTRKIVEVNVRSTSGVHNINSDELQALPLPIPSLDEQREAVRLIQNAFDWLGAVSDDVEKSKTLLDHLDEAHLAKAFRGELVPQDPNDEPASALLDRIRSERATQPRARRGRRGKAATRQEATA